ncbi:biotin transporter BioY [Bacillus sp. H-16]|uniref:biotin transporter BioY n=1 Tax=Alteribacter salitolerans TaxID=2912333 RepID=UPI0019623E8D|nr:biotin transporter BioY [Alteribacter salitolerans]MBM7097040.1 biotin transporter BioY [Alteribacter salitolerans]
MNTHSSKSRFSASDITKAAMFIALMAIGANATAFITIGTVPMTFQPVVAILAGALLGSRLGSFSIIGYTVLGLIGAPVFAQFSGGPQTFVSPTFGFILSFILMAYVTGKIVEKSKGSLSSYMAACFAGLAVNYVFGVTYLYLHMVYVLGLGGVTYLATYASMGPFFIKDFILTGFAASICPQIANAVNRRRPVQPERAVS